MSEVTQAMQPSLIACIEACAMATGTGSSGEASAGATGAAEVQQLKPARIAAQCLPGI